MLRHSRHGRLDTPVAVHRERSELRLAAVDAEHQSVAMGWPLGGGARPVGMISLALAQRLMRHTWPRSYEELRAEPGEPFPRLIR